MSFPILQKKKIVLQIVLKFSVNVKTKAISNFWNFEVGSYVQILRKMLLKLLVPNTSKVLGCLFLARM